jgi:hypothetical protein
MNNDIYNLMADNKPLPRGTRIITTQGGIPTGGKHELPEHVLAAANRRPNSLSDHVPFWILGWQDLHNDLLPPITQNERARETDRAGS